MEQWRVVQTLFENEKQILLQYTQVIDPSWLLFEGNTLLSSDIFSSPSAWKHTGQKYPWSNLIRVNVEQIFAHLPCARCCFNQWTTCKKLLFTWSLPSGYKVLFLANQLLVLAGKNLVLLSYTLPEGQEVLDKKTKKENCKTEVHSFARSFLPSSAHTCVHTHSMCEDNMQALFLSFHYAGPGDWTQVLIAPAKPSHRPSLGFSGTGLSRINFSFWVSPRSLGCHGVTLDQGGSCPDSLLHEH